MGNITRQAKEPLPQSTPQCVVFEIKKEKYAISKIYLCNDYAYNIYLQNILRHDEFMGSMDRINGYSKGKARSACFATIFTYLAIIVGFFGGVAMLVTFASSDPSGSKFAFAFIPMFGIPIIASIFLVFFIIRDPLALVRTALQHETEKYSARGIQWILASNKHHIWIEIRIMLPPNQNYYNQQPMLNPNQYNPAPYNPAPYNPAPYNLPPNNPLPVGSSISLFAYTPNTRIDENIPSAPMIEPPPAYSEIQPEGKPKRNANGCPKCGASLDGSYKFCGNCGQQIIS